MLIASEKDVQGLDARMVVTAAAPRERAASDSRISWSLRWFAYLTAVCAGSGALLYCYDLRLASWRTALVWLHDVSGDAALVLIGLYLVQHLPRTWSLRRARAVSWWTGIAAVGAWGLSSVIGVYGQFEPIERHSLIWWLHSLGGLAAVVAAGFHAAYGYRAKVSLMHADKTPVDKLCASARPCGFQFHGSSSSRNFTREQA